MFECAGDPIHPHDLDDVPTDVLQDQIQTLAGHLAAATCAFLVMVAEFDRREAYQSWECMSTAHWLSWRCGMSLATAREQVRVARRLVDLPVVLDAFSCGQLSYSKVRAISRVAHPGIEAGLVGLAQHATTSLLEQACSALRRCQDAAQEEERLRQGEAEARDAALLSVSRCDGMLSGRLRLGVEDSEVFSRALAAAVDDLGEDPEHPFESIDRRRARALTAMAAAYLADPGTGPGPQPEMIVHVDAAALRSLPDIEVDPTAEADDPAQDVPARDVSAEASDTPVDEAPDSRRWPVRLGSGTAVSVAMLTRLACDAGFRAVAHLPDGTQLDLGRHRRTPNAPLRRALLARDVHCRFPGCHSRRHLHAHHIIWWVLGGRTDLDNLIMLCPKHHTAVHDRHWTLTGTASDPHFARPDGRTVDRLPPPPTGDLAALVRAHRIHGLDIAVDHAGGRWEGDHIDWDCFFAGFANPLRPPGAAAA